MDEADVDVDGIDNEGTVAAAVDGGFDVEAVEGVSNSTGFVRGVACTLVINFARAQ